MNQNDKEGKPLIGSHGIKHGIKQVARKLKNGKNEKRKLKNGKNKKRKLRNDTNEKKLKNGKNEKSNKRTFDKQAH